MGMTPGWRLQEGRGIPQIQEFREEAGDRREDTRREWCDLQEGALVSDLQVLGLNPSSVNAGRWDTLYLFGPQFTHQLPVPPPVKWAYHSSQRLYRSSKIKQVKIFVTSQALYEQAALEGKTAEKEAGGVEAPRGGRPSNTPGGGSLSQHWLPT